MGLRTMVNKRTKAKRAQTGPFTQAQAGLFGSAGSFGQAGPFGQGGPFGPVSTLPPSEEESEEFASQFTSSTFKICFESSEETFHLHKHVLKKRCPYFNSLLTSRLESQERKADEITLPLHMADFKAFHMIVEFLYTGSYELPSNCSLPQRCFTHAKVYLLSDLFMMEDLKTNALDKMRRELSKTPGYPSKLEPHEITKLANIVYRNPTVEETEEFPPHKVSNPAVELSSNDDENQRGTTLPAPADTPEQETEAEQNETESIAEEIPDPRRNIQILVARYAASYFEQLREDKSFLSEVSLNEDFIFDIMSFLKNGSAVSQLSWG